MPSQKQLTALVIMSLPLVAAAEVSFESKVGYDDNPFRLNTDLFSISSDTFVQSQLKLGFEKQGFQASLRASDKTYENDSRADEQRLSAGISYQLDLPAKMNLSLGVDFNQQDRSFVSRFSGDTFMARGQSGADRYDYQRIQPSLQWQMKPHKKHKLSLELAHRQQRYEDLTALGLFSLDYDQTQSTLLWRYQFAKTWRISPELYYAERDYKTRPAEDAEGENIEGLVLHYTYVGAGAELRYKPSRKLQFRWALNAQRRVDNGGGFYDTDTVGGSFRLIYKPKKYHRSELRVTYSDLDYKRNVTTDVEANSETPSRSALRFKATHERPLFKIAKQPLMLELESNLEAHNAELVQYQYDRYRLTVGLNYSL